jgi:hypothetical protein
MKTKWALNSSPTYKTLYEVVQETLNTEIPKRNFSPLSKALVFFRGWPLFFRKTLLAEKLHTNQKAYTI